MYCFEFNPAQQERINEFHDPSKRLVQEFPDLLLKYGLEQHVEMPMRAREDDHWEDFFYRLNPLLEHMEATSELPHRFLYLIHLLYDQTLAARQPKSVPRHYLEGAHIFAPWQVYDADYAVSKCCFWFEVFTFVYDTNSRFYVSTSVNATSPGA